ESSAFACTDDGRLTELPRPVMLPPAAPLFHQGAPAREVFYIEKGLVKLRHLQVDGREIIVGLRGPGWFLAASATILDREYPVTPVTATACLVSRLPSRDFLSRLRDDPALSWRLHRAQSQEVYEQAAQVANLGCQDARHRLEQLLDQ